MGDFDECCAALLLIASSIYNIYSFLCLSPSTLAHVLYLIYGIAILWRNADRYDYGRKQMAKNLCIITEALCLNLFACHYAVKNEAKIIPVSILIILPLIYLIVRFSKAEPTNRALKQMSHLFAIAYLSYGGYVSKNVLGIYVSAVYLILHFSSDLLLSTALFIMTCGNTFGGLLIREMGEGGPEALEWRRKS